MSEKSVRATVIEALSFCSMEGVTLDDLYQMIEVDLKVGSDREKRNALSKTLSALKSSGHAKQHERGGKWYPAKAFADQPEPVSAAPANSSVTVAPFTAKRTGKIVTIYKVPDVLTDVIGVSIHQNGIWYKLPLFGSIRICHGHDAPMWSPEQESYTNVSVIMFTLKGGKVSELRVDPKDVVTIAPPE